MPVVPSDSLLEKLGLSQTDINNGFEFRDYDDKDEVLHYITSDSVNRHLRADSVALELMDGTYEPPEKHARYAKIMLEHQLGTAEEGQFEDHRICGLFSDLSPESEKARIQFGMYFDMLATFKAYPYQYKNDEGHVEFTGAYFVYNDFGVVYPLSRARSVNPIGASTLAITADRKVLVQVQPEDDAFKPGSLMPSGSGVTSYHDYVGTGVKTLQELVVHTAEYKLVQECNIPDDAIANTVVLGMARVPVGMKPDFFCVTELSATWDELVARGATAHEVLSAAPRQRISEVLRDYIARKNAEKPGIVSIQLYLGTEFLAEVCR